jgi:choice-of-anchor B domain-containing protein
VRQNFGSVLFLLFVTALAAPASAQVGYGATTATTGSVVLIGEPGNLIEPGLVYVYRPEGGGWQEVRQLQASDGSVADGFGRSIAVDREANWAIIGADAANAAYIVDLSSFAEVARLAVDGAAGGKFGSAVALGSGLAVVGAPAAADGQGAAYVFRAGDNGWTLVAQISGDGVEVSSDDAETSRPEGFGASVAIAGDSILVGAPGGSVDMFLQAAFRGGAPNGAVYTFRVTGDDVVREDKISPPFNAAAATFGFSVAASGDSAIVGAPTTGNFAGAAHVLARAEDGWTWTGQLMPFDSRPGAMFGAAVTMGDRDAVVGSPGAGSGRLQGRLYAFRRNAAGEWAGATKLASAGLKWGSTYGASVSMADDVVVGGMPGDDYGAGSAVIMTRLADGWERSRVLSGSRGLPAITGNPIACEDGLAGMFECEGLDLVAFLPVDQMGGGRGVTTNDLWGWTDPETGRDYVIQGLRDGTAFVDVTVPEQPVYVGKLAKTDASPASLWRDVKVHQNHAFIVADASGPHGVQIFDLTKLREYSGTPMVFAEDAHYGNVHSTHNIFVNEDTSFAYAVGNSSGGETCGGALHMINVEDPRNPVFAGCFQPMVQAGRGASGTHDVQCVTYHGPDDRYEGHEICVSSDGRALNIGDVTDKRNPKLLANATYPNLAYTHQGWLDEEHEYFYMNDEGDEAAGLVEGTRTLIWDVRDLEDPIMVGEYVSDSPATDHNLYIVGDLMYQSNYRSGLHVFDISDRENIRRVAYFDTVPWGENDGMGNIVSGAIGSWSNYPYFESGIIAVGSGKEGLFILRLREDRSQP